jgi:hypothetical protein
MNEERVLRLSISLLSFSSLQCFAFIICFMPAAAAATATTTSSDQPNSPLYDLYG